MEGERAWRTIVGEGKVRQGELKMERERAWAWRTIAGERPELADVASAPLLEGKEEGFVNRKRFQMVLFEAKQWDYLVEQFKQEFCRLYGMTLEPLLNIYLQAGLSALKTPFCYEEDCTKEDPLSQEHFRKLASPLPFSKQHHSKLVCYISKELMDFDNPPLVLPNGYVYSTKALEEMAKKNDGKINCPRTGFTCNFSELVKAFIS